MPPLRVSWTSFRNGWTHCRPAWSSAGRSSRPIAGRRRRSVERSSTVASTTLVVAAWDIAFADLFFIAHDADLAGESPPRPWRLAFAPSERLNTLQHLLLGMNAHINFDPPQALLAVITDDDFTDPALIDRRRRDHERIDQILASRVSAEDSQLGGSRRLLDHLLTPLNRAGTKRFVREARQKVWRNTFALQQARLVGSDAHRARLAELEPLSAAKIAELTAPGQVVLRLAAGGLGVVLPPP